MTLSERSVELPWLISQIGRPNRLLDIGSSDGVYTGILYELCRDLTLCDTRYFNSPVQAHKFIGSAHKLPDDWSNRFDLVTCLSVLDHVGLDAYNNSKDDTLLQSVVGEIYRVLTSKGRLLVTFPFGRSQVTKHPSGGQRIFSLQDVSELFKPDLWECEGVSVWKLCGDHYEYCTLAEAENANYDTWRAEACIAIELVKI